MVYASQNKSIKLDRLALGRGVEPSRRGHGYGDRSHMETVVEGDEWCIAFVPTCT